MVPNDIVNFIQKCRQSTNDNNKQSDYYDHFQTLELLNGQSISDFNINNPVQIEADIKSLPKC